MTVLGARWDLLDIHDHLGSQRTGQLDQTQSQPTCQLTREQPIREPHNYNGSEMMSGTPQQGRLLDRAAPNYSKVYDFTTTRVN